MVGVKKVGIGVLLFVFMLSFIIAQNSFTQDDSKSKVSNGHFTSGVSSWIGSGSNVYGVNGVLVIQGYGNVLQNFNLEEGKSYDVNFSVYRTSGSPGGLHPSVKVVYSRDYSRSGDLVNLSNVEPALGFWKNYSFVVNPENSGYHYILLSSDVIDQYNQGYVFFDDVSVIDVDRTVVNPNPPLESVLEVGQIGEVTFNEEVMDFSIEAKHSLGFASGDSPDCNKLGESFFNVDVVAYVDNSWQSLNDVNFCDSGFRLVSGSNNSNEWGTYSTSVNESDFSNKGLDNIDIEKGYYFYFPGQDFVGREGVVYSNVNDVRANTISFRVAPQTDNSLLEHVLRFRNHVSPVFNESGMVFTFEGKHSYGLSKTAAPICNKLDSDYYSFRVMANVNGNWEQLRDVNFCDYGFRLVSGSNNSGMWGTYYSYVNMSDVSEKNLSYVSKESGYYIVIENTNSSVCTKWFDGCNTCNLIDGGVLCSKVACVETLDAYCIESTPFSGNNHLFYYVGKDGVVYMSESEARVNTFDFSEEQVNPDIGRVNCPDLSDFGRGVPARTRLNIDDVLNYCDPSTLEYIEVVEVGESCINDYECSSNVCIEGECVALKSEVERQSGLLREIYCWLKSLFTSQTNEQCLAEN
jgi:hypothetical protein